jgi:hypothetical protein
MTSEQSEATPEQSEMTDLAPVTQEVVADGSAVLRALVDHWPTLPNSAA